MSDLIERPTDAADPTYPDAERCAQTLEACEDDLLTEAQFVRWQGQEIERLTAERDDLLTRLDLESGTVDMIARERDDLRRQLSEAQKEIHNLNWALGTDGYAQMATPEEQAEHEAAVRAHHDVLERLEEGKRAYDAMKLDAQRYRWLRNEANTARKCDPMVCIYPLDDQDLIDGDRLDVAIDAAMGLTRPAEES